MPGLMTTYCLVLNKFGAVLSLDFAATTESFKQMPQFCSKCRISFCVQPPICLMSRERLSLDTNFVYFFYLIMTLFEIYPKMTQNRQTWSGHIGGERFSFALKTKRGLKFAHFRPRQMTHLERFVLCFPYFGAPLLGAWIGAWIGAFGASSNPCQLLL